MGEVKGCITFLAECFLHRKIPAVFAVCFSVPLQESDPFFLLLTDITAGQAFGAVLCSVCMDELRSDAFPQFYFYAQELILLCL